jgi:hypothetical protein
MVLFEGLLNYVFLVFLVLVFAEYTKLRSKLDKQFAFITGGAIWLLLAYLFTNVLTFWGQVGNVAIYGLWLFEFLGFLLILIGALWAGIKLISK